MTDKQLADIICRALLAIVSALRRRYGLPDKHGGVTIILQDSDTLAGVSEYVAE